LALAGNPFRVSRAFLAGKICRRAKYIDNYEIFEKLRFTQTQRRLTIADGVLVRHIWDKPSC
jgi:hypothetical protein